MELSKQTLVLRVLFVKTGELWAAQCIDYDIAVQGDSVREAKQAFEKAIIGQILFDLNQGRVPLSNFRAAPDSYREKFDEAERLADDSPLELPKGMPPAFIINQIPKDLRIW